MPGGWERFGCPEFWNATVKDGKDWGAGAAGSPVVSGPYWFFSPKEQSQMKGLPPILVFAVVLQIGPTERLRASIMIDLIQARLGAM